LRLFRASIVGSFLTQVSSSAWRRSSDKIRGATADNATPRHTDSNRGIHLTRITLKLHAGAGTIAP
jgi:hypothetical protein